MKPINRIRPIKNLSDEVRKELARRNLKAYAETMRRDIAELKKKYGEEETEKGEIEDEKKKGVNQN